MADVVNEPIEERAAELLADAGFDETDTGNVVEALRSLLTEVVIDAALSAGDGLTQVIEQERAQERERVAVMLENTTAKITGGGPPMLRSLIRGAPELIPVDTAAMEAAANVAYKMAASKVRALGPAVAALHTMRVTFERHELYPSLEAKCHDSEADCHYTCAEECEIWWGIVRDPDGSVWHEAIDYDDATDKETPTRHRMTPHAWCNVVEWLDSIDTPLDVMEGPAYTIEVPITTEWDADGLTWSVGVDRGDDS